LFYILESISRYIYVDDGYPNDINPTIRISVRVFLVIIINQRKMLTCASKAHVKDAKIEIFS
jgi:uncharacterized protein (DUF2267 family)